MHEGFCNPAINDGVIKTSNDWALALIFILQMFIILFDLFYFY
jgi:hypothetical protein